MINKTEINTHLECLGYTTDLNNNADYDTINKNLKWVAKDDEYVRFCLHKSINTVVGMYTTIKIKEDKKMEI